MYEIKWEDNALRELERLPKLIYSRIFKKIDDLKKSPYHSIKKLKGENSYSLRIGDYRVILTYDKNLIIIWKIGHRRNIYKK